MADNGTIISPSSLTQLLDPQDSLIISRADGGSELADQAALNFGAEFASQAMKLAETGTGSLAIGLVDCYRFSRECLTTALESFHSQLVVLPFSSVQDCHPKGQSGLDLIIYYPHAGDTLEAVIVRDVGVLQQAMPGVPIVVLSDVEDAYQPRTIRSTLNSGAHGFIPTRSTGILVAIAAIRFVKAGGTFAPLEQLLAGRSDRGSLVPGAARQSPLTSRQMAVLSHLQQGKANKIIAHELSMSESTVKVHVRNIMRKIGATNRTQAAYKARQLWSRMELTQVSDQ